MPVAALAAMLASGCGGETPAAPDEPPQADLLRARAEALHAEGRDAEALDLLAPLTGADATAADLLRAAILALALNDEAAADAWLERARALAPQDASVLYLTGVVRQNQARYEEAEAAYRGVLAADPSDLATKVRLADVLDYLGRGEESLALLRQVRASGVDADPGLYTQATYMLAQAARGTPEAEALLDEYAQLTERGLQPPGVKELEQRGWGRLRAPSPRGVRPGPPSAPAFAAFEKGATLPLPGATELLAADVDADGRADLVAFGPGGVHVARQDEAGAFAVEQVTARPAVALAAGDIDEADPWLRDSGLTRLGENPAHQPGLELACVHPGEAGAAVLVLWSRDAQGAWSPVGAETPAPEGARAALFSDFDHDSLLDLLVAGARGVSVLRNHGGLRRAGEALADVTPDALAAAGACRALQAEDFDADNDVDYLVLAENGPRVFSNLRGGRFEDMSAAWRVPAGAVDAAQAADLDEDGRTDLLLSGAGGLSWSRGGAGGFAPTAALAGPGAAGRALLADLDLDGHVDLVHSNASVVDGYRGPLTGRDAPLAPGSLLLTGAEAAPVASADFDGDLVPDLAVLLPDGATLFRSGLVGGRALRVDLAGTKDNFHGVGAVVELRAGASYRRVYARGEALLFGLGDLPGGDVLRVTWPNGVPQFRAADALAAGARVVVEQPKVLGGSCPFLYAWDGSRYAFVSDCLGASPLGLPAAPGLMVPWRSDEQLTLRGEQLVPREGELRLVLTEELREVTYLDRVALHAIDHPADVEVQTDERFGLPPFAPPHVHALRDVRPVARALAAHGGDVTALVAAVDGETARPFRQRAWQYTGLAEPWSVDLVLVEGERLAELRDAPRVRLLLTAWMQWGDASVNMAAARHPDVEYELPALWVPEGDDPDLAARPWRRIEPPVGFPSGKTKTMVLDVTDLVRRDDPRLRLTSTLQLGLDAVRVCLSDDEAPRTDTRLEAARATLGFRGFSRLLPDPEHERAELFAYDQLMDARWNQHPGLYTRYGEVAPLLAATDDRYAIFGAGDALWVAFDAAALPPLPAGWRRDWVLELDGWAKDGDPNTVTSQSVEPLPFHGMSAYPPPPGEDFADPAAAAAWRAEWNTRPAATLLVPLAGR